MPDRRPYSPHPMPQPRPIDIPPRFDDATGLLRPTREKRDTWNAYLSVFARRRRYSPLPNSSSGHGA